MWTSSVILLTAVCALLGQARYLAHRDAQQDCKGGVSVDVESKAPEECRKALTVVSQIRIYLEIAIDSQTEYRFLNEKDLQILSVVRDFSVNKMLTYKIITLISPGVCEEVEICNGPLVCATEYCIVRKPERVTCPELLPSCPLVR
ncbi:unnamed protein product [Dicrocoelium dendriticum]|nr:unnamed protein product [Dicrocoelium dendriticum]